MKVLIGCEFSGVVRRAFRARGHDAWSCDLLPAEDGSPYHIQCDQSHSIHHVLLGGYRWDLGVFHPPCTFLCNSGVRWLAPASKLDYKRHKLMCQACDFFAALYWSDLPRIGVENPVMHKYAREYLMSAWNVPSYTQTIQPYEHGHGETKRTCLWLRGLPLLKPTLIVNGRKPRVHFASPGVDRWKERSRTLPGVAEAMAMQWGNLKTL